MRIGFLWLALLAATPAAAQDLDPAVKAALPQAIEFRHAIHAQPELSNREEKTAALVAQHLQNLGLEVRTGIAHTGVVAVLRGSRPGPVVAVRADMDALPVRNESGLPFATEAEEGAPAGEEGGAQLMLKEGLFGGLQPAACSCTGASGARTSSAPSSGRSSRLLYLEADQRLDRLPHSRQQ